MKCSKCQGGADYVCPGCVDKMIIVVVDPDSDSERLERHRKASSQWPDGRPETHAERALRLALDHLDKVLNGCRTAVEQQAADSAAREFIRECGR